MKRVSKGFYLGSWIAGGSLIIILLLCGWLAGLEGERNASLGLNMFAFLPLIYIGIVWLVLLYKAWAAIQDGQTPVSPGKAIGFLFIPFYSYYWIFRAVWGFAREYNAYIKRHSLTLPDLSDSLFMAFSITWIVAGVLQNSAIGTGLPVFLYSGFIVIGALVIDTICNSLNGLVTTQPGSLQTAPAPAVSLPPTPASNPIKAYEKMNQPPRTCPVCSSLVVPGARFCGSCGKPLQELPPQQAALQVRCRVPGCGHTNAADARFCEICGANLQKAALDQSLDPGEMPDAVPQPSEPTGDTSDNSNKMSKPVIQQPTGNIISSEIQMTPAKKETVGNYSFRRYPKSGICDVCNKDVGPDEAFLVPVDIFYSSVKYKKWLPGHMPLGDMDVETFIMMTRVMDKTAHSAVCPNCIWMFS